jgi:hypothetical protein
MRGGYREEQTEGMGHSDRGGGMGAEPLRRRLRRPFAAPSHGVPNSGASHNCVATTSGVLFFREHGIRLGQEVRLFAPHGGQRDYVQGALQETC